VGHSITLYWGVTGGCVNFIGGWTVFVLGQYVQSASLMISFQIKMQFGILIFIIILNFLFSILRTPLHKSAQNDLTFV